MRNLRTRLPFRYGVVTLTHFPLLHLAVDVETADGRRGGFAADNLPKWFGRGSARASATTSPTSSRSSAPRGGTDAGRRPRPVFEVWQEAYAACARGGPALGLNGLTAAFGSSLFERALADAAGRLTGRDVIGMLRDDVLGIRPEAVHRELTRDDLLAWARRPAPDTVAARHTVGFDPIVAADAGC
jgi:hypothetical protein